MAKPLKIDLYTDIVCPWCLIGERRLDNILAADLDGVDMDIEHHPMLLMPDLPDEGIETLAYFRARFGNIDPKTMWDRPQAEARKAGIMLDLSRQTMLYPTIRAHTLVWHARSRGTQHALASSLTQAYFLKQARINDPDSLADIAVEHGSDREEALALVLSDEERQVTIAATTTSARRGVRSVPTFVINGQSVQPESEEALAARLIHEAA